MSSVIGLIVIAGIFGFGYIHSNQAEADPELSIETIKEQVSGQYPGAIKKVELDTSDGNYLVEMETKSNAYELKVDGDTSRIIQIDQKEQKPMEKKKEKKEEPIEEETPSSQNTEEVKNSEEKKPAIISQEEAIDAALAEFQGTVEEIELDEDDGKLKYEIEMVDGSTEAELEVDAYTGKVMMVELGD